MKHSKVLELVKKAYESTEEDFGKWMWKNHVPFVAKKTLELSKIYQANEDIAVAGALLHDFGDVFMYRHADNHDEVSIVEAKKILKEAEYSEQEILKVLNDVIDPHSCRDENLPKTIEGKVMATADALAHLTTDFYIQFTWKHIPENKTYTEFLEWVKEKLERDFYKKIFFEDVREQYRYRYEALKEVFVK
jgi:HD superfamily phosphodiesterase